MQVSALKRMMNDLQLPSNTRICICGDFNSVRHMQPHFIPGGVDATTQQKHPMSGVYQLLSTGGLDPTHVERNLAVVFCCL